MVLSTGCGVIPAGTALTLVARPRPGGSCNPSRPHLPSSPFLPHLIAIPLSLLSHAALPPSSLRPPFSVLQKKQFISLEFGRGTPWVHLRWYPTSPGTNLWQHGVRVSKGALHLSEPGDCVSHHPALATGCTGFPTVAENIAGP